MKNQHKVNSDTSSAHSETSSAHSPTLSELLSEIYYKIGDNYFTKSKYTEERAKEYAETLIKCHDCYDCGHCNQCTYCCHLSM